MATLAPEHYPEYPDASAAAEGSLPLRELLTILRRRRRVIFWVVILLTSVATLTGLQVTPTSTATAFGHDRAAGEPYRRRRAGRGGPSG